MQSLRLRLEERIQKKHLLSHPWYVKWQAGKLTKGELQGYAKEYYHFEKEFPRFISAIHSRCEDLNTRQLLLENLIDEERGHENHPELWLRFAEGLGMSREDVKNHFYSDETQHLLSVMRKHTTSANLIDGLAALYAYERQQPDVVRQKAEGLKNFYGICDERPVEFFRAHQNVDVYHAEAEVRSLEKLCQDENSIARAESVVQETLDTLYDFLDGVDKRYAQAA